MHVTSQHPHTSPFQALPSGSSAFSGAGSSRSAATANASAADTGSSGSDSTATITANDFLQLLVTELENQDPTADTDPNEYVNQLVQVNSLEQLIQINQNTAGSSSSGSSSSGVSSSTGSTGLSPASPPSAASAMPQAASAHHAAPGTTQAGRFSPAARNPAQDISGTYPAAHGNLSPNQVQPPGFSAAAHRIAGALASGNVAGKVPEATAGKAARLSPGIPAQ